MATKPQSGPMTAAEHAALRSYLQSRGVTAAKITAAVGASPAGRSRSQVRDSLLEWLRTLPKG